MRPLGLSAPGEAAYRIALRQSRWDAAGLLDDCARLTSLPAEDCLRAVEELTALGLLRPAAAVASDARDACSDQLRVVAPNVVLEAHLTRTRERLLAQQREVERDAELLSDLQDAYVHVRESHVEHGVERLTGLDAVRSRLEELAQTAQEEALSFTRGVPSPDALRAAEPLDRETLARGVNLRSIYVHGALNDPATAAALRALDEAGAETRTVAALPLQMLIVDRRTAVVPLDVEQAPAGALVIRSQSVVVALLALFESVWLTARPLGAPRRPATPALTDTDREVLRILARGATDEVVARQLAVSVRTVRRLTSDLLSRFSARSRFELGLRLGQQGWTADLVQRPPGESGD